MIDLQMIRKERFAMRIAVTYEAGQIFQHFGHTETMKIYDVEDGKILSSEVVDTNGSGHGALAGFLAGHGVEALICGGIGGGARNALAEAGITLYPGVSGSADEAVEALLAGKLDYNPDTVCSHHHGEDHDCGSHGEGHDCGSRGEGHDCGSHGAGCGAHKEKQGGITVVTAGNFEEEVTNSSGLTVVDFWADWCGPCKMLAPVMEELSREMTDVKFCKVNVDEEMSVAMAFRVASIPTLAFFRDGKYIDQAVGYQPKEVVKERIEQLK